MTTHDARRAEDIRRGHLQEIRERQAADNRRRRRIRLVAWITGLAVIGSVLTAMFMTSKPQSSSDARVAPDFTLTDTAGAQIHLADLRGQPVLLYFSEGAGCQSCLVEMAEIEKSPAFAGLRVLPIVMNTSAQITADMAANGVKTPFLLDDGKVSTAYGTIGKGMHAGLPGHSFLLIDKNGMQQWYGEYPSMWISPTDLMTEVRKHLA